MKDIKRELDEVIIKKALGFSYTEEVVEFESLTTKKFVLCVRRGRLYFKNGFLKVHLIKEQEEIKQVALNNKKNGFKAPKNHAFLQKLKNI